MIKLRKPVIALLLAAYVGLTAGCGDKKSEVPKDLGKELPPPPTSTGGKGGKDTKGGPTSSAQ